MNEPDIKKNMPAVKLGLAGVSRDCFPRSLALSRTEKVLKACQARDLAVAICPVLIETEQDALRAAFNLKTQGANAAVIYLGNFGPEGPLAIFAREFGGPCMLYGAAEESFRTLGEGRGDAFCGLLNASYNCALRGLSPWIPERPVGLPGEAAAAMAEFAGIARVVLGLRNLKVISFGPRPQDFFACNAPIAPLYGLGIEVMENSELDLLEHFRSVAGRTVEIARIAGEMTRELGAGNGHPEKITALAQFELALQDYYDRHRGARAFAVFANKCWPGFEGAFHFVPCFVNSRLAGRGIPVACETDIYGAVSEYVLQLAAGSPVTLLDVNNTVPADLPIPGNDEVLRDDLFMGFHCGNTASCMLCPGYGMKHQLIMHRLMEPGREPDITAGTLEGALRPGAATLFRLAADPGGRLMSYLAEGRVLDADPCSFGSIGVIGIPGFARFYRHVLLEKHFPHHVALTLVRAGRTLFEALKMLGLTADWPLSPSERYPGENPFGAAAAPERVRRDPNRRARRFGAKV